MTPIYLPEEAITTPETSIGEREPADTDEREQELMPMDTDMGDLDARPMPKAELPEEPAEPLMALEEAVASIPEALRAEMEELLRADFREVVRWKA